MDGGAPGDGWLLEDAQVRREDVLAEAGEGRDVEAEDELDRLLGDALPALVRRAGEDDGDATIGSSGSSTLDARLRSVAGKRSVPLRVCSRGRPSSSALGAWRGAGGAA